MLALLTAAAAATTAAPPAARPRVSRPRRAKEEADVDPDDSDELLL